MKDQSRLPPAFSLYLDVLRFMAAGAVFLDHLTSYPFSTNARGARHGVALIGSYGASAVTVFFVLSGFVIAYVVSTREKDAASYAVSRLSRLYSVVLPALILTLLFDTVGQWLHPDFYAIRKVLWTPPGPEGYLGSLFFVNEFRVFRFEQVVPGSNAPFWSLSFEAAYYLIAGLLLFAPRWLGAGLSLLVLALAGRTIAAMAPLWGLGFWLYHARHVLAPRIPAPLAVMALSVAAILAAPFIFLPEDWNRLGLQFPWGRGPFNRDLRLDYVVALAFALHLLSAHKLAEAVALPTGAVQRLIRYLGSLTFPMYAAHYPVLCLFAAISPWDRESVASVLFTTLGVGTVIAFLTPLCEVLKGMLRDWRRLVPAAG